MKTIVNLQYVRAIAAVLVVISHGVAGTSQYGYAPGIITTGINTWGDCGVDLFFVLSGFLMVVTQAQSNDGPITFLNKRLIRIVPMYYFFTLILAVTLLTVPSLFSSKHFELEHLLLSLSFSSALATGMPPLVVVGWTLEYEMLFYAAFAASLFIPNRAIRIVLLCVVLSMLLVFKNVWGVILEFCFGMLLALLFLKYRLPGRFAIAGVVIGAGLLMSLYVENRFGLWERPILWGLPAAVIVYSTACAPTLKSKTLRYLGDASYSIYLVHLFVLPAALKLVQAMALELSSTAFIVFYSVAAVVAGCLCFSFIERRVLIILRRHLTLRTPNHLRPQALVSQPQTPDQKM